MNLKLTHDVEGAISREAHRRGTTPEAVIEETLRDRFAPPLPPPARKQGGSLADELRDFIGCIHSGEHTLGGAQMSKDTGRQFAEGMAEKRRQGRL